MTQQYRMEELELGLIVFDKELQVRVETSQETIHDYYEAMATEEDVPKFPPPTVYFDGCRHWLADGHHRYWAAHRRGYPKMLVKVIDGSHDDAILAAVKLNAKNGLRFNEDDWEKIIPLIASKDQWKDWSNRRLAQELGCSEGTVRNHRTDHSGAHQCAPEKRRGRDGKLYPSKMSKKPKPAAIEPAPIETATPDVPSEVTTDCSPAMNEAVTPNASQAIAEATMPNVSPTAETTTPTPDVTQPSPNDALAEAKACEELIFETIANLENLIDEWFSLAPPELYEEFDNRFRKRIAAIID